MSESMMSYGTVQQKLRAAGIVMSKPKGRYRINFFGGLPGTEQYTSDLKGALEAGLKLASTRKGPAWPSAVKSKLPSAAYRQQSASRDPRGYQR
jgi:hypothetical protein